jgi:hypothetical protein
MQTPRREPAHEYAIETIGPFDQQRVGALSQPIWVASKLAARLVGLKSLPALQNRQAPLQLADFALMPIRILKVLLHIILSRVVW